MLTKTHQISAANQNLLRQDLLSLYPQLEKDVSRYAPGRNRLWLKEQSNLQPKERHSYTPAVEPSDRLWQYCLKLFPEAELGLLAVGGKGISFHRDSTYAASKACLINLGRCTWNYCHEYKGYDWQRVPTGKHAAAIKDGTPSEFESLELTGGEVFHFNCKNLHAAIPHEEDRLSIVLWHKKLR